MFMSILINDELWNYAEHAAKAISHFRVTFACVKTSLRVKPFDNPFENEFHLQIHFRTNQTHFHLHGFEN